jgi:raffinose/stachyose/melibiose transport system permease protein
VRVPRSELWFARGLLILLMTVTIVPFISLFTTALHPSGDIPLGIAWPADPQWGNFAKAFTQSKMGTLMVSSLTIVLGVVPIALIISTMAGFAIGHLKIPGHRILLLLFIFGLTLPFEAVITPIYYIIRSLRLIDTKLAIILPLIGLYMPFAVFWMRAHFVNVPRELSEAARVDGAGTWDLFLKVHVPLARPALVSLGILLTVWTWNQFILALVLVNDPLERTVAGALGAFQGQWGTDIPLLCAGSILILLPSLIVFLIFQRQVIAALLQGSVKG